MSPHATVGSDEILIVGGGASAVFVTFALRDRAAVGGTPAPRITVVGREPEVGRGLAYGRADEHHRLNSPAGKMSLSATDDAAFLRYLDEVGWRDVDGSAAGAGTFVPRRVFGDYVASSFAALSGKPDSGVRFVQGEVVDVAEGEISGLIDGQSADGRRVDGPSAGGPSADGPSADGPSGDAGVTATLADGRTLSADRVVLALGNPAPGLVPSNAQRSIDDPWAPGALDRVTASDRILLIGTGLTMIDVATSLARRSPGIRLTATSRHLMLPAVHLTGPAAPGPGLGDDVSTLGEMATLFGRQLRDATATGSPWQAVLDGLRPQTQALWLRLSVADRERFLAHAARRWDVHRHRMAPAVWAELSALLEDGTLTLKSSGDVAGESFDVAINCTGPASVASAGWSPLVDRLLGRGTIVADPTGIGVDADPSGFVRSADGEPSTRILTIGAALKGALWETVAIGEVRQVAYRIADAVLAPASAEVAA